MNANFVVLYFDGCDVWSGEIKYKKNLFDLWRRNDGRCNGAFSPKGGTEKYFAVSNEGVCVGDDGERSVCMGYTFGQDEVEGIWRYFTIVMPTSSNAVCSICQVNVPRGGDKTSNYNTTNLMKHLQRFNKLKKQKGEGAKQLTLEETTERIQKFPHGSVKAAKITESILNFIVMDGQPLSVVENKGFRLLINHLEPRYNMVKRKYLSETALPEFYQKMCKCISEELKDVKVLSFTTDIWSSDVSPMSLLREHSDFLGL